MEGERISTTEVELADCPTMGLTLGEQTEGGGETEINDGGGQSGRKCVIVASALRAEQGPCEPIKGCIREIREQ